MSVREDEQRKNPSRGLGLAAAAIGVGVGAALYYFLSKRPENPQEEGSTSHDWRMEHAQTLNQSPSGSEYTTITEHTTTDTSVYVSTTDTSYYNDSDPEFSSNYNNSSGTIFHDSSFTIDHTIHHDDSFSFNEYGQSDSDNDNPSFDEDNVERDISVENVSDDSNLEIVPNEAEDLDNVITISDSDIEISSESNNDSDSTDSNKETSFSSNSDYEPVDSTSSGPSTSGISGNDTGFNASRDTNSSTHCSSINSTNFSSTTEHFTSFDGTSEWDVTNSALYVPSVATSNRQIESVSLTRILRTFMGRSVVPNKFRRQQPVELTEEEQMNILRQEAFRERSWSLEECSICFDVMLKDQPLMRLPCAHNFHVACIGPWLQEQQTCPNCRKPAE